MLDDLILLRLLCAGNAGGGMVPSEVGDDLFSSAADPDEGRARWKETVAAAVDRLAQAGTLTKGGPSGKRLLLTLAGEQRARDTFAVPADHAPVKRLWRQWRDQFAVPKALHVKHPPDGSELRAALLLEFYLPEARRHASGGLLAAVDLLLSRKIAAKATPAALRHRVLRAWVAGQPIAPVPAADPVVSAPVTAVAPSPAARALPENPPEFAALVRETARRCETGHFGENKVFVSHVWRTLAAAGYGAPGQEIEFKERLIRANTAGDLRLSRADLAGAHDARDVNDSEIRYLGETFHFLRLD